jgi:hypothetical protein
MAAMLSVKYISRMMNAQQTRVRGRICNHLDVSVGNTQTLAVVDSDEQLLKDPARFLLRHGVNLH